MTLPIAILNTLEQRKPQLLTEATIRNSVEIELSRQATIAEIKMHLRAMETNAEVVCIHSEDIGNRYTIAPNGAARLAKTLLV